MRSGAARFFRSRAAAALFVTGLTSTSGLMIAVAVARTSTVSDTGRFGIAASVMLLLGAVARSGGVDPLVVLARRADDVRSLGRASCIALFGAAAIGIVAAVLGSAWLGVAAIAAHGCVVRECVWAAQVARGRVGLVALVEVVATIGSGIAALGAIYGLWDGFRAFAAWALISASLGYVVAALLRSDIVPSWRRTPISSRRSVSFVSDTLIGSGTVQASTWVATAVGGLSIAGGIRGAGTLAGPVTVVLTAIRTVLLPRAVAHASAPDGIRRLVRDMLAMAGSAMPFLVLLVVLPEGVGQTLLGDTWRVVAPVMPLVAMELLLQVAAAPAEASHRAVASEQRILSIRLILASIRISSVLIAAPHGLGAVLTAALATTTVGAVTQWASLVQLRRRSRRTPRQLVPDRPRESERVQDQRMKKVALIVPEYRTPQALGGGLAALADFVEQSLDDPGAAPEERLSVRIVVPRMYHAAPEHWSIRRPRTWLRGPRATRRTGDREIWDVGTWFPEIEGNRYRPRRALSALVDDCDAAIVVAGTPALGSVLASTRVPWALEVASLVEEERAARLASTSGWRGVLLRLATASTRRADRSALRRPDEIVTINDSLEEKLRGLTNRPVRLLTPGVDTDRFRPATVRADDGPIVMVSRLNDHRKDLPTLLRAYHRARNEHGVVNRLVLAGRHRPGTPELDLIAELGLADVVDIVSSPTDDELADILRSASCFALASREEGLGVVFLEAMASGLPIVTTATRGARYAVPSSVGDVLPFGEALIPELAGALARMTADRERSDRMGAAARHHALQEFDRAVAAARWRSLAWELIRSGPQR